MASPHGLTPLTSDISFDEPPTGDVDTADEKRTRSLTRSKQWKEAVAFARVRQELYRKQAPGGIHYNNMPKEDNAFYSAVGNAVMEEYDLFINTIEGIASGVSKL